MMRRLPFASRASPRSPPDLLPDREADRRDAVSGAARHLVAHPQRLSTGDTTNVTPRAPAREVIQRQPHAAGQLGCQRRRDYQAAQGRHGATGHLRPR